MLCQALVPARAVLPCAIAAAENDLVLMGTLHGTASMASLAAGTDSAVAGDGAAGSERVTAGAACTVTCAGAPPALLPAAGATAAVRKPSLCVGGRDKVLLRLLAPSSRMSGPFLW